MRTYTYIESSNRIILPQGRFLAVDIETTGLNPRKDSIVGLSCAWSSEGYYTTNIKDFMNVVQNSNHELVFHNAVFDLSFLSQEYPWILKRKVHDSMLLAHLINSDRPSLGLKDLSNELLGERATTKAIAMWDWLKSNSLTKEDIHRAPKDILTEYACEDAINTYEIFLVLARKLKEICTILKDRGIIYNPSDYYTRECSELIPVVVDMQMNGVRIDLELIAKTQHEMQLRMRDLTRDMSELNKTKILEIEGILHQKKIEHRLKSNKSGKLKKVPPIPPFAWDSNNHLKMLFIDLYKMPVTKLTDKGNPCIDSDYIESIKGDLPWVDKLLEYKELKKLTTTYLSSLLEKQEGGYIHANFHISGTATGRLSSSSPNLQNLPRHGNIKKLFVPREGYKFVYADYSQLELRIAAHLSQDRLLLEEYNKQNPDLHQRTADFIKVSRSLAKTINFAIVYNASGWRIADIMGWMEGIPLCKTPQKGYNCNCTSCNSRRDAVKRGDEIKNILFGKYTGLKEYCDKQKDFMVQNNLTISPFGKFRRLNGLQSEKKSEYNHALKAGFNLPIQSMGASLCKRSMVSLHRQGYKICNQIHDSIIVEVPSPELDRAQSEIKKTMENIFPLTVPLLVEPKILTSFMEG